MIIPVALRIFDLKRDHVYVVAAVEKTVGVSFQARLLEFGPRSEMFPWVLHFSGGLTLSLTHDSDSTFFEVVEGV